MTYVTKMSCGCFLDALFGYKCWKHKGSVVELRMKKLMSMAQYPDPKSTSDPDFQSLLFSFGYCFDYIKGLNRLKALAVEREHSKLLQSIVNPLLHRNSDAYILPTPALGDSVSNDGGLTRCGDVQLIPSQLHALHSLRHSLELLPGPPGDRFHGFETLL
jgi:hypothetical protein